MTGLLLIPQQPHSWTKYHAQIRCAVLIMGLGDPQGATCSGGHSDIRRAAFNNLPRSPKIRRRKYFCAVYVNLCLRTERKSTWIGFRLSSNEVMDILCRITPVDQAILRTSLGAVGSKAAFLPNKIYLPGDNAFPNLRNSLSESGLDLSRSSPTVSH